MIPPILNDAGDCCCQCPPNGQDSWCHCNDDYNGKGDDIENAITCDLIWTERQANGRKKYFKVVSGSSQQNMPVVLPTASLTKRGVVQLTNDLSDREDLAVTPKSVKGFKERLDRETADRINGDNNLQSQIDKEKTDRANADTALANRITTLEQHDGNHVTSVESNGDATVTVTKQNGTKNSFTINNVAHASSADSATNADHATNANHAKTADSATTATNATNAGYATNASHADVADKVKNLDTTQLGKVSLLSSRTGNGTWTLSNVVVNKPIFITHNAGAYPGGCALTVISGSDDLKTKHLFGVWATATNLLVKEGAGACAIVVPTQDTVELSVEDSSDDGDTLRAYQ